MSELTSGYGTCLEVRLCTGGEHTARPFTIKSVAITAIEEYKGELILYFEGGRIGGYEVHSKDWTKVKDWIASHWRE